MKSPKEDVITQFKEMKAIGKPPRYDGCKLKYLPRPRHPPMERGYKPPWDNSPPSSNEPVVLRPTLKDEGRQCQEESTISRTAGYRIVNGWQVDVDESCHVRQKTPPPCLGAGSNYVGNSITASSRDPGSCSSVLCMQERKLPRACDTNYSCKYMN